MRRLRGWLDLVHDAIDEVTDLVEETQHSVADKVIDALEVVPPAGEIARTVEGVRRGAAAITFGAIRATNKAVRAIAGAAVPESPESTDAAESTHPAVGLVEATLNAAIGDRLAARGNALHIEMEFRHRGRIVPRRREAIEEAFPNATGDVVVFVHGLGCTEREFAFRSEEFYGEKDVTLGTRLERELGITPVYVRYNTGLHISDNGRRLASILEEFCAAYPRPIERLSLVGHSMGGLVVRSAVHYGMEASASWLPKLAHVFAIGSPHLGAPLEQASHVASSVLRVFDVPGTVIPAKVLDARSAGIKDLRYGYVVEEDWKGRTSDAFQDVDRTTLPLAPGVRYHSIAACVTPDPDHPVGRLLGDLMVRTQSARGHADDVERSIPFEASEVITGIDHLALVNHPKVYEQLRAILERSFPTESRA